MAELKDIPLQVKIFSPYQDYYEGKAVSVSALNRTGPFDILSGHANFFSVLEAGEVTVDTGTAKHSYRVERGILKVTNNQVTLFANV